MAYIHSVYTEKVYVYAVCIQQLYICYSTDTYIERRKRYA